MNANKYDLLLQVFKQAQDVFFVECDDNGKICDCGEGLLHALQLSEPPLGQQLEKYLSVNFDDFYKQFSAASIIETKLSFLLPGQLEVLTHGYVVKVEDDRFAVVAFRHQLAPSKVLDQIYKMNNELVVLNRKLQKSNKELLRARDEIKTLQELLPICSHCKKIRDEQGHWEKIESYFRKRSSVDFSHSLCPQCLDKYYPE